MYDRRDHLHLWAPVPYIIFIQACFYFVRARRRARHKTGEGGSKANANVQAVGLAAFDVTFHSLLIEVQSMVNSQILPSTDQPGIDNTLFCNNSILTLGWSVRSGI